MNNDTFFIGPNQGIKTNGYPMKVFMKYILF